MYRLITPIVGLVLILVIFGVLHILGVERYVSDEYMGPLGIVIGVFSLFIGMVVEWVYLNKRD